MLPVFTLTNDFGQWEWFGRRSLNGKCPTQPLFVRIVWMCERSPACETDLSCLAWRWFWDILVSVCAYAPGTVRWFVCVCWRTPLLCPDGCARRLELQRSVCQRWILIRDHCHIYSAHMHAGTRHPSWSLHTSTFHMVKVLIPTVTTCHPCWCLRALQVMATAPIVWFSVTPDHWHLAVTGQLYVAFMVVKSKSLKRKRLHCCGLGLWV